MRFQSQLTVQRSGGVWRRQIIIKTPTTFKLFCRIKIKVCTNGWILGNYIKLSCITGDHQQPINWQTLKKIIENMKWWKHKDLACFGPLKRTECFGV
jgi:hypothetical protein